MGNLVGMAKAIQRVLMEEELRNISSKIRNGDIIKITKIINKYER